MFNLGGLLGQLAQAIPQIPPYKGRYRCFPVAALGKGNLEAGDKIILPPSALDHLARLRIQYPMLFQITCAASKHKTHCGVMEFSAEEGVCYLPFWMMQNLLCETGGIVELINVSLPKGTYVKFQAHSTSFTKLYNPRVVLERALRNFSCLTVRDTIAINHGDTTFYLDVTEVKPGNAVTIIETDVNVDFDPPKDYKEEDYKSNNNNNNSLSPSPNLSGSSGSNNQTSMSPLMNPSSSSNSNLNVPSDSLLDSQNSATPEKEKQNYFAKLGQGHSLAKKKNSATTNNNNNSNNSSNNSNSKDIDVSKSKGEEVESKRISKEIGQFTYIYEVDSNGKERLIRRFATPKSSINANKSNTNTNTTTSTTTTAAANNNPNNNNPQASENGNSRPSSAFNFKASKGYSLK